MTTPTTGINQRIRELRRAEGLNQKEFGQRIGLVQAAISRMEQPNMKVTEANINLLCKTFGANPAWLRTGLGEMYQQSGREQAFTNFIRAYKLDATQVAAIRTVIALPPQELAAFMSGLLHCADTYKAAQSQDAWAEHCAEAHRRLDMELEAEKQGYSSASREKMDEGKRA